MPKRSVRLSLRLSKEEAAHLNKLVLICGSKKEPLIRRLIMNIEVKPRPPEAYTALLREVSGIATNINQITRLANMAKSVSPAQVEELQRLCGEALYLLKENL